jgi:SET domain-containing protein
MSEQPPIVVRRSLVQGLGVFAARRIAEGERILEYTGVRMSHEDAEKLCQNDEASPRHHTFLFAVDDGLVIDGAQGGSDARFLNHSCAPNCEVVVSRRRVFVHALRDIAPGDELTYDYWYTTDESYTMDDLQRIYPCRCRSAKCRGTLARPPKRQKRRANAR